jgi:hypothetical protein
MGFFGRNPGISRFQRLLGAVLSLLLGVGALIFGGYRIVQVSRAKSWKKAPRRILEAHTTSGGRRSSRKFRATYEYVVDGQTRIGKEVAVGDDPSPSRMTGTCKVGYPCEVLYNPANPAESALVAGGTLYAWFALGLGMFLLGSAVMAVRGGGAT